MSHHFITISGLGYSYPDGTSALEGIDLTITHSESVAVVGPNGAGKSTLLRHLNGTLVPQTGSVDVGGTIVSRPNLEAIRRTVGMVFCDPDDQLFMPTVSEDVAFGPINLGWERERIDSSVRAALESVGALALADRPPYRLSTGEKRRAAIATVLVMAPEILVLDEPASGLDPRSRRLLIELLATFDHTKIIATHDLDLAADLCERTIIMNAGRIVADGPTLEHFADRALLERNGLEQPLSTRSCRICGGRRVSTQPKPMGKSSCAGDDHIGGS